MLNLDPNQAKINYIFTEIHTLGADLVCVVQTNFDPTLATGVNGVYRFYVVTDKLKTVVILTPDALFIHAYSNASFLIIYRKP